MKAKSELKEYEEAIKSRQEKYEMKDVAQIIVENKILLDKVDAALGQAPSSENATAYDDISQSRLATGPGPTGDNDSLLLSQSYIGASMTLTNRGGPTTSGVYLGQIQEADDLDEIPDSIVDKLYNDLLGDRDPDEVESDD